MTFKLPELPYAYDALSPYMSKETLEFHHDKHHQAYVDNGNKVAGPGTKYDGKSIEDICREAFAAKDAPVINNIGQHYNHIHFWQWMKKGGGGKKLPGKLQTMVDKDLGGFDKMRSDLHGLSAKRVEPALIFSHSFPEVVSGVEMTLNDEKPTDRQAMIHSTLLAKSLLEQAFANRT